MIHPWRWFANLPAAYRWLALTTLAYPFLFLWQGIDLVDEGNALVIYQRLLIDPASIADTFGTWGTTLIGALWNHALGSMGVLGFRFAGALVSLLTILLTYALYRDILPGPRIVLGVFLGTIFCYHFFSINLFGYNNFSLLLLVAAMLLLIRGLQKNAPLLLMLCGMVLGFAILARIPNLLAFVILTGVSAYHCNRLTWRVQARLYAILLLGAALGFGGSILIMIKLGHWPFFLKSLSALAASTQSTHGPYQHLPLDIARAYWIMLTSSGVVLVGLFILLPALAYIDRKSSAAVFLAITLGAFAFYNWYAIIGMPIAGRVVSFLTLLCFVATAGLAWRNPDRSRNTTLVAWCGLCLLLVWPLGSGAGFTNYVYTVPIFFPLVLEMLLQIRNTQTESRLGKFISGIPFFSFGSPATWRLFGAGFIALSIANALAFTYHDDFKRMRLRSPVASPLLADIYTTPERAEELNEALAALNRYVAPGDTLFVAWVAPLFNYLTQTRPYFTHPWSEIYPEHQVRGLLARLPTVESLPVTIRYQSSQYDALLNEFLAKNGYHEVWHGKTLAIYIPPTNRPAR